MSHEAASLGGHLKLGRLVYVYDDNHITIDGPTELSYSDDAAKRFEAYGWHVDNIGDVANDLDALESALRRAMAVDDAPSLIILRSHIGWPSPKYTDTEFAHGNPLGEDEIRVTKEILGLPPDEHFYVPDDVLAFYREAGVRSRSVREEWEKRLASLDIDRAAWDACLSGTGLNGWESKLPSWSVGDKVATRKSSGACLQALVDDVPGLMAGGADLTGNTGTVIKDHGVQSAEEPAGRQIYFGVREHGMASVMNGMTLHGGTFPSAARSSSSATTCAEACGSPRSAKRRSSTPGRTTRSGSDKTARPTSRSNTSRRCGRCRACASSVRPTPTSARSRGRWPSSRTARPG